MLTMDSNLITIIGSSVISVVVTLLIVNYFMYKKRKRLIEVYARRSGATKPTVSFFSPFKWKYRNVKAWWIRYSFKTHMNNLFTSQYKKDQQKIQKDIFDKIRSLGYRVDDVVSTTSETNKKIAKLDAFLIPPNKHPDPIPVQSLSRRKSTGSVVEDTILNYQDAKQKGDYFSKYE